VRLKTTKAGTPFLVIPDNCWALVAPLLDGVVSKVSPAKGNPRWREPRCQLGDIGEVRWAPEAGVIRAQFGERTRDLTLTPYQQTEPIKWASRNVLMHHAPGAGKTITALLWALLVPRTSIVVVTPACVRLTWQREIRRCTTIEPLLVYGEEPYVLAIDHSFVAAVSTRVNRELVACAECGRRAEEHIAALPRITVVAWEILAAHVEWLVQLQPHSVVYDESQYGRNKKRARMLPAELDPVTHVPEAGAKQLEDGRWVTFEALETQAAAASRLAKAAVRRCATTATPVKNRRRDLWAQLDNLDPFEWGSYMPWAERYCGATRSGYNGSLVDTGTSNTDELRTRLDAVRSRVPASVSHALLPRMRRDLFSIPISEQCKSDVTRKQLKAAALIGPTAELELALMDACARKRRAVCAAVASNLAGAGDVKIVVFTGRRADADAYGAELRKLFAKNPEVRVWSSHGGDSEEQRQTFVDEYFEAKGPAVFVGTGDAFGLGINGLHDTDICYTAMLPWTPGDVVQREYRFLRQGSTRPVLLLYCVAEGTADEHVVGKVIEKLPDILSAGHEELETFRHTLRGGDSEELIADLASAILKGDAS
jgi:hypothetical protein